MPGSSFTWHLFYDIYVIYFYDIYDIFFIDIRDIYSHLIYSKDDLNLTYSLCLLEFKAVKNV